jgi:PAS domain S-box-containing protein
MWEKVFGFEEKEMCSRPWLSFVHPEDIEGTIGIAERMESAPIKDFINRYRKKDGSYQKVKWITSVFSDGKAYAIGEPV